MYLKTLRFDKEKMILTKDNIYSRLQEASFLNQVETIKQGFYGRDKKDNFFLIKISDSIINLEIQLESDDYELMDKLSNIIFKDNNIVEDIPTEDLFSFIRKISGDISVIKNIMIFYLVLTILGFILSIFR